MLYESEGGNLTIALVGDLMLTRRLSIFREDRFLQLRDVLRGADVAFANFESTARNPDEGNPTLRKGTYMTTAPDLLEDVKWLGINLISCANNHAYDYGEQGVLATIRHLFSAKMPYMGIGRNLAEARSPVYLDTPGGRVACIAMTSRFDEWFQAGEQRPDFGGKPGVNTLGFQTTYTVDNQAMMELRRISKCLGLEAEKERRRKFGFRSPSEVGVENEENFQLLGKRFRRGESFSIRTKARRKDVEDNLRQLHEARRQADWVIVSLHCHELGGPTFLTAGTLTEVEDWAEFAEDFARECIDEGADLVVGHGSHFTLGVELYKGKPIFHGLGGFVMQNETAGLSPAYSYSRFGLDHYATPADFLDARSARDTKAHPADPLFWESVCAVCQIGSKKLRKIILHPLDLGFGKPRAQRGRPLLADHELGKKIISRLKRLSENLRTEIAYEENCGTVTNIE